MSAYTDINFKVGFVLVLLVGLVCFAVGLGVGGVIATLVG